MAGISLLPEHLSWMRRNSRCEKTIRARRVELVRLCEYLGADPAFATYDELDSWQCTIVHPVEMRRRTALIRPYYGYIHAKGIRPDNPAALLPMPKPPRRLPHPISEEKLAWAIGNAPERLHPWLLLAGWCGLRAGGVASLNVEGFFRNAGGEMWAYYVAKGGDECTVAVPEWVWQVISPGFPASGACFRQVRGPGAADKRVTAQHVSQYCNEYLHRSGIPDVLHSLRHRVGTIALANGGGDIRLVQEILGHKNITSAQIYTLIGSKRQHEVVSSLPRPRLLAEARSA